MTDRELLELAAKAAGYEVARESDTGRGFLLTGVQHVWNPLTDDGDALRLAVKLQLDVLQGSPTLVQVVNHQTGGYADEPASPDRSAATRRAIVRAAAELGKSK